jgi:hypothetical protein
MSSKECNGEFVSGDYKYEPTGKFEYVLEKEILRGGWLKGHNQPTKETLKPGLVFVHIIEGGGGLSRTAFVREDLHIPYIVIEERSDSRWVVSEKQDYYGNMCGVLTDTETNRDFYYKSKDIAESMIRRFSEWKCEVLKKTRLTDES